MSSGGIGLAAKNRKAIKDLIKDIEGLRDRDIPYIASTALNNLAFDGKQSIDSQISEKLNIRKKKLTTSVRVKKATKTSRVATIFIDAWSWQHKTLKHHFFGGDRDRKGVEKALIQLGYMSSSEILTPPPGVSIKPSSYIKMIAQLKLVYKSGYAANETKKSKFRSVNKRQERYFLINSYSHSHLHPGVYLRMADNNKPICILRIVKAPKYKQRLASFEEVVNKIYDRRYDTHLSQAMQFVLKKNRGNGWI